MSKRTVVTDYIQNKLNSIKKDSFLKEMETMPIYQQKKYLSNEIDSLKKYITMVKNDKKSYQTVNGKEQLIPKLRENISSLNKIVAKYKEYYKFINLLDSYSKRKDKIEERIEFESTQVVLSSEQVALFNDIDINISNISFHDLIILVKYMIQNYEFLEDKNILNNILKELNNRLFNSSYSDEVYIAVSSIKNVICYKTNTLDKKNPIRLELNALKKYVKSMIKACNNIEENNYDYKYEIIDSVLHNKYYFNRMLEELPDSVNLIDKEGHNLSYNVVAKYLDSYLLELQNKPVQISKDEYATIYKKIIHHPNYNNSISNKQQIDILLNNFINTIKEGKFSRSKYLEVIGNLNELANKEENLEESVQFDSTEIFYENKNVLKHIPSTDRVDLSKYYTFAYLSKEGIYINNAYSINKNDDESYELMIHVTDIREYIKYNSILDNYLRDKMFNCGDFLDQPILKKLSLSKDELNPVLTFSVKITKEGKIKDFKCTRSNIVLNDVYSSNEFTEKVQSNDSEIKHFVKLSSYLNSTVLSVPILFNTLDNIILDCVGKYFANNKLPYIYKVQDEQDSSEYINTMSDLNGVFSKINNEDFKKIYNIICEDTNYSRYSNQPIGHYSLNQKYYTDLFIPLYSYVGVYLQDLIYQFLLSNEMNNQKKNLWNKETKSVIDLANTKKEKIRNNNHKQKLLGGKQRGH